MNNSEFDIIKEYFTFSTLSDDVLIASGDDCASVSVPEDKQLLVTVDTLISGVHFPVETTAENIAYKAMMVNLSDLAAMGATPAWVTLAITLPEIDHHWLSRFSKTISELLKRFNISLIGGDTTKGELSITIQAMGLCDKDKVLRRDKAKPGDKIYVTGDIGDAAIGLHVILNSLEDEKLKPCINKLNRPEVKVGFAEELVLYSDCAIDISDGLIADLGHILKASLCGANIKLEDVPLSSTAKYFFDHYYKSNTDWSMVLTGGDDYELCFTVNNKNESAVIELAKKHHTKISCIGEITDSKQLDFYDVNNELINFSNTGFKHF